MKKKSAAKNAHGEGTKPAKPSKGPVQLSAPSDAAELMALTVELGKMIEDARQQVAVAANAALTMLYWQIGHRVGTDILANRRAEYGAQIVAAVGRQLEARYGRGFGEKNLRRMVQFASVSLARSTRAAAFRGGAARHHFVRW